MHQIALAIMGPIFDVHIVNTLSFHKMAISIRDAVVEAVLQSNELCPIWDISTRIWIETWSMYQIALGTMGPCLDVRIIMIPGPHKMTITPRDAVI